MAGTFLKDSFVGAANADLSTHTPDSGGSWAVSYMANTIELDGDGQVRCITGPAVYEYSVIPTSPDVIAVFQFEVLGSEVSGETTGVQLRSSDGTYTSGYRFDRNTAGTALGIDDATSGSLASYSPVNLTPGTPVLLRASAIGSSLKFDESTDGGATYTNRVSHSDSVFSATGKLLVRFDQAAASSTSGHRIGTLQAATVATNYTATLSGSSTIAPGASSGNITLALNGALLIDSTSPVVWTPSDGSGGGTFTGGTLSTYAIDGNKTTTYSNATPGFYSLSFTNNKGLTNPAPISITVSSANPTSATFAGPSSGTTGQASATFTVTLNAPAPSGGTAVALSDASAGGTFAGSGISGSTLTIAAGQTIGTFTYLRSTTGTSTLTPTASGITFAPTTLAIAFSTPTPTLVVSPSTASVATGTTLSITATRANASGTLAATATGGTLSTASPTSGTPFTWTAPGTTGSYTITVADAADSLTAACVVTVANVFRAVVPGFATGLSTVTAQLAQLPTLIGSPVVAAESPAGSGIYYALVPLADPTQNYDILWSSGQSPPVYTAGNYQGGVTVGANNDKTGYGLAPTGLDAIATTAPTTVAGINFRQMIVMTYRRWFKQATASGSTLTSYADDNTTAICTQPVPPVSATQQQGAAS